jgi:HD superfamily phosphohydrolase
VYPGAHHTRLHHAMGAMHLMNEAIHTLRMKGVVIDQNEEEAALIAVLLHDIGHGPFSHALEHVFIPTKSHEELSLLIMQSINKDWNGALDLAIAVFTNTYSKRFLHQLVSSQLDVDRLDYLTRDSFFTGVAEGVVSYDRIIKMLTVENDELMVEEKGVNSIENFLISRRLMYWQVYLHKTVIAAEEVLLKTIKRARLLVQAGEAIWITPVLKNIFLESLNLDSNYLSKEGLSLYLQLDDAEIMTNIKYWASSSDKCLALLSRSLINRNLPKTEIANQPITEAQLSILKQNVLKKGEVQEADIDFFVFTNSISNYAYRVDKGQIKIKLKNGAVEDVLNLLTHLDKSVFSEPLTKYYVCYPKP